METANVPREPTADECGNNAPVDTGFACWYPQMGGYVGKCVIVPNGNGCFDAYVWHDGQFPFAGEADQYFEGKNPVRLHHCMADQFIEFGQFAAKVAS